MKKILTLVVALLMVLSISAFAEAKDVTELNVWSIVPKGSGIYWDNMQQGAKTYCEEVGITNYTLAAPTETANVQQQIELCETAVTSNADILILRISDPEAFLDVVERATQNGTIVLSYQQAPGEVLKDMVPAWAGISPDMLGEAQAKAVIAGVEAGTVAEDASVFYLSPTLTNPTHIANCDAFCRTLSEAYPNMTIITDETGSGNDAPVAADLLDAYFLRNPDISVLVANGANETNVMAAKAEGLNRMDDLWVVGCDGGEDQAEMLYIGSLDVTVEQDTFSVGYESAKNAVKIFKGEPTEFYTPVGCRLLMPADVEEYCAKYGFDMTAWNSYKG